MNILLTLLFSVAANLDTLGVAVAYGIKNIKVKKYLYLIIAFISTLGTFASMSVGFLLTNFINEAYLTHLGALILIIIGIWFIKDFFVENNKKTLKEDKIYKEILINPSSADKDKSGDLNLKECVTLSLALTINNIGVGIGASVVGLNIMNLCIFTFIITIILFHVGISIGKNYLSKIFGKYSSLISGVLIIIIGIYEIIQ